MKFSLNIFFSDLSLLLWAFAGQYCAACSLGMQMVEFDGLGNVIKLYYNVFSLLDT